MIKGHLNPYYSTAKKTALYDAYLDKNLNITEPCNTEPELENLNRRMDAFVCGSDQIWSPSGFDPKYFLSFVRNPSKMVAYAPSIGLMNIKHPYVQERMRFLINRVGYGNTVIAIDVYPVHVSIGRKNCCPKSIFKVSVNGVSRASSQSYSIRFLWNEIIV